MFRIMKKMFLFFILTVLVISKPLLYKLEYNGETSYLSGSIHVGDEKLQESISNILDYADKSDYLYFEIDLTEDEKSKLLEQLDYTYYKYEEVLTEKEYSQLSSVLFSQLEDGIPPVFLNLLPVETIAPLYEYSIYELSGYVLPYGVEEIIKSKFSDKEFKSLETIEETIGFFKFFDLNYLKSSLEYSVDESKEEIMKVYNYYIDGDTLELENYLEETKEKDKDFYENLVISRNKTMSTRIIESMIENKEKKSLYTVGVLHLVGDMGIVNLLEQQGVKVTKID